MKFSGLSLILVAGASVVASNASEVESVPDANDISFLQASFGLQQPAKALKAGALVQKGEVEDVKEYAQDSQGQAQTILKSMKHVAATDVDDALVEASGAQQAASSTIQTQVAHAQQTINDAAGAVTACHAQSGIDQRADLRAQVDREAASLATCMTEAEVLRTAAAAQCEIAQDCLCDNARDRRDARVEVCATRTEVYEASWCAHNMACTDHRSCHETQMGVYNALRADVDAEMTTIRQEYTAVEQSNCLTGLIMRAMSSGTAIDPNEMAACSNVDTTALEITYPALPATPDSCPAATIGNPQCV